jgi:1-acyl-sn-glycerol-3-phosphate acyltransferase
MNWQPKSSAPPPGYTYGPRYRPSADNILRGIAYIALGRPRSLAHDALWAVANMPVAPRVRGIEHVPETGPLVLTANHYERPGLWMAWPALFVSQAIWQRTGRDTHWVAIEEWESFALFGLPIDPEVIRRVFARAFNTYGIIAMPAPSAPGAARAAAMRSTARRLKEGAIIGIMPEGDVGATPELLPAREGVGTFLGLLMAGGTPVIPTGLYEEEGRLVAEFGAPLSPTVPSGMSREDADRAIREQIMRAIAGLLPEPLRGAYRSKE